MTKVEAERAAKDAELRASVEQGIDGLLADPLLQEAVRLADGIAADAMSQDSADPLAYVRSQCLRAAGSIMANIAEGAGRGYSQDGKRFLCIARGSAYETVLWLRLTGKDALYVEALEMARSIDSRLLALLDC